jgi:UDP-glucose 4-epimerase
MLGKRVLIAGGVGFIESHLAENLIEKGFLVKIKDAVTTDCEAFPSK